MRWGEGLVVAGGAFALALGAAQSVAADPLPRARLELETPGDAELCPGAQTLRDLVASRLGRDPFDDEAPVRIEVSIARADGGLSARVELRGSEGETLGTRRLSALLDECEDLLGAASVVIALALDPASGIVPPPEQRAATSTSPEEDAHEPPATPVPQREDSELPPLLQSEEAAPAVEPAVDGHERPAVSLGIGPSAVYGHMPEVAPGVTVAARVHRARFVLALEGSAHFSAGSIQVNEAGVRMNDLALAALPCLQVSFASACGVVTAAVVEARRVDGDTGPARTVVPRVGIRVAATWRASAAAGLTVWLQGDASIVQPSLQIGGERGWTAPPIALGFGLSLEIYP